MQRRIHLPAFLFEPRSGPAKTRRWMLRVAQHDKLSWLRTSPFHVHVILTQYSNPNSSVNKPFPKSPQASPIRVKEGEGAGEGEPKGASL